MTPDAAFADHRSLAASLAPLVVETCSGKLGSVTWFRTDWQRGGAATGKSHYALDDGRTIPVILKLPVNQREIFWTQRLQADDPSTCVVPRLLACGETLGGYDLAWIVIEAFPHGPLGSHWHEDHIPRLAEAAARFHLASSRFEVDQVPTSEPWHDMLAAAAQAIKTNHIHHEQRWAAAIKAIRSKSDKLIREWNEREESQWLHGDLHLANAMSRVGLNEGPVSLIDLAEVHAGHWIEDAIYLERQLWAIPERMKAHKPVKDLAAARKALGLPVEGTYLRLAMIRRALLAATAPRFIKSEGRPAYLEACLQRLEIALNELK